MLPDPAVLGSDVLRQALHTLVHISVAFWSRSEEASVGPIRAPVKCICDMRLGGESDVGFLEKECERAFGAFVWWAQLLLFFLEVTVGALGCLLCVHAKSDRWRAARAPPRRAHGVVFAPDSR